MDILPVTVNSTELSTNENGFMIYSYLSEEFLNDTILEIRCPIHSDDNLLQRFKKIKTEVNNN